MLDFIYFNQHNECKKNVKLQAQEGTSQRCYFFSQIYEWRLLTFIKSV